MASNDQSRPTTFTGAMRTLGGIAGFLWGGAAGNLDPEIGFWIGALVGAVMGVVIGWAVGLAVRVALHLAFLALAVALIGLRIYSFVQAWGY